MKKLSVMIVLAGMLLADQAGAQTYSIWGAGGGSCGTWVTDRHSNSDMAYDEFTWVQGYITGLNAGLPNKSSNNGQVGAQLDPNAAEVWLDTYCQAHPIDMLSDAAYQLYDYARSQNR
jgi:hypothetical protein